MGLWHDHIWGHLRERQSKEYESIVGAEFVNRDCIRWKALPNPMANIRKVRVD